ncbi:BTAD domain-containing putative transcriptional regulator [Actinoplanes sp. URMC 104]|uniref:BTAD domain-containing putative transcriptional regulator n=1 Tax=Actinoplanes sp. URMC 104 TaxID=3423409 RepID=UPI003F1E19BB
MRFRLLGPLEVRTADGTPVEPGGAKPRALLTLLLSEAGRVVSVDRVVATLWGDAPPPGATGTVQAYVSQLRRLLGRELIVTRSPGYLAAVDPADLDLARLPALLDEASRPGDPHAVAGLLTEAVELWRGEPLADLPDDPLVVAERARLAELHVLARQRRAVAWAGLGRTAEAVAELERLVAGHPLREGLWAALIEALYAAGRQGDALEAYRRCARTLADELGIDPSPELRALEQAVLRQDPALSGRAAAAVEPAAADRLLVGRQAEQARLRAALAEVTRGSGAVLVLEGEAGIGKTRLAEAAASLAGAQGWRPVWSRCADDAGVPALWPWSQILERLGGGPLRADADGDPTFALFAELRRRLAAAATATPLLVVLDDVQAADATSLALLTLLARHLEGLRLLVVLTVRTIGEELPAEVVDCLAALAREPRAQRLQLTGLTANDVRELIAPRSAGADVDELARVVHERTDGNPFFAGELVELMAAEGRVDTLPPSVRDVLDRRLSRLPSDTVDLLRLVAVIGRDAELPLLEAAAGLDAEQVITRLEPAVAGRVLRFDETAWRWRFSHALVRETLLAGLSRIAAARLHARVAGELGEVDRLAYHYFHAVPVTGAAPARRYAIEAAAAAREQHAHAEAAMQTRRALALLGPDADQRHRLLVELGDDLLRAGRLTEAQEVVAEAIAVARRLGDHDRLAAAASVWGGVTLWNWRAYGVVDEGLVALLEELATRAGDQDPALRARLLGTLGVELAYSPTRRRDSVAYAERAVELARTLGDPDLLGRTINNYMISTWGSADRVDRWTAAADEALALAGRGLPLRTEFFARLHRGPLLLHLGDAQGFDADLAAATRLAGRLTGPDVRPHLLYQETGRAMLRGQWAEGEQYAIQAYERFRQTSLWGARFCSALHTFTFRGRDGRLGEAVGELVEAAEELAVPLLQGTAVLAAAQAGDLAQARRLRRRWPEVVPRDWTTDSVLVVHAWIALALGGDLRAAYASLEPLRGRQIVVGTAGACWGSYDLEMARLADALELPAEAAAHRRAAAEQGERVGSAWQVEQARKGFAR